MPLHCPHPPRRLTALLLVAAAVSAAPAAAPAEIVGGAPVTHPYPHQALLEIRLGDGRSIRCGGTLIAARYVLTAAHCINVEGSFPESVAVTLGQTDVTAPARNFSATQWEVHPSFRPSAPQQQDGGAGDGYDAAILRLDKAAEYEQARLLRPRDTSLWAAGTTATVIGWGLTEDESEGGARSNQLREVAIPIYSDAACDADFLAVSPQEDLFDAATMLCAGGRDGKDACGGDSGGPLLVPDGNRFALAGVVSFGAVFADAAGREYSCAENVPGVYSRVAADPLNQWIRQRVPQVEIDLDPPLPEPGQQVTLTAAGTNPNGPYGAYEWDLDGDGAFDDATGTSTIVVAPRGVTAVAVRATRGLISDLRDYDQEVRRVDVDARFRSPVGFAAHSLRVTEGRALTVTLRKAGNGAGSVVVGATAGTALFDGSDLRAPEPATVAFAADQTANALTIPTVDDHELEGPETFTLDLRGYAGELIPGTPAHVTVTIVDDEVRPRITGLTRSASRRSGGVRLRYRITTRATVVLRVTDRRGRAVLATGHRRHARRGTYSTRLRLTARGKRRLRTRGVLDARAVFAMFSGGDLVDSRVMKLRLRR